MYETRNKMRMAAGAALAVLVGAFMVACGGGGGSGGAPAPTAGPTPTPTPVNGPAWLSYGGDAQHAAIAGLKTQDLDRIVWRTPVDVAPQYTSQGYLLVHYGSPVITSRNTVLIPVKRAVDNLFRIEARIGGNGALAWSMDSDYVPPAHNWTPSYNVTLTKSNRMVAPGAGGKVLIRDDADSASASTQSAVFYGSAAYTAAKAALDASVFINTPISADAQGNIYFGFVALAGNPAGLSSGVARIGPDGVGSWAGAAALAGDPAASKPAMGSAPAISADQKTLYVVVNGNASSGGYLLALDAATLALKSKARLLDPQTGLAARISDDSTASPTVGPDGDVYLGVLESTMGEHNARGWLLHFDATLGQARIPGSFGWDDTASIVPAAMLAGYSGNSPYLVMTKYNNYARAGTGDAKNKVAVLDPNASQPDFISGLPVMKEVLTILGPTPDPNYPGGVDEWCINTAAVDPFSKSILVNSEDGYLYRWDLASNTLSQKIRLTSGLGESYTPTAVGADGTVYAINNAVLFAVGK
jgi:hypothetical protein